MSTDHEYMRVELRLAAVRYEDYDELKKRIDEIRRDFCRGGSSLGIGGIAEGTVINP